jgi:type IV pilus assembly protein PilW
MLIGQLRARSRQSGLSIVELLVGVALGLFVVAGATTLVAAQLGDSKRLVLEAQMQQDLRATADIITREIRRAGYWGSPDTPDEANVVWLPDGSGIATAHYFDIPASAVTSQEIRLVRSNAKALGFRLDHPVSGGPGVLRMITTAGGTQDLTDIGSLDVFLFSVTVNTLPSPSSSPVQLACPKLCPDGTQTCWPTLEVREVLMTISGRSIADPNVTRTVFSHIRLRNDRIVDNLPATTPTTSGPFSVSTRPLCPA